MQNSNNQNTTIFKSTDLSLISAILVTKKAKLVDSVRVSPYKFEFHLAPADVCYELKNLYVNSQLSLPVDAVADKIRLLKSLMKAK